jgi:hypothetical protein
MKSNLERAKQLVPTIILTVLSMIQALALEFFWTKASSLDLLWQKDATAILSWLMVLAILDGILLFWVTYVNIVLRFSWIPTLREMVMPFLIGIVEFAMIELMHPDSLSLWLLLMASAFAAVVYTGHLTHRAARQDPANAYYFRDTVAFTWRDYKQSGFAISSMLLLSLLNALIDSMALALGSVIFVVAALSYQFVQLRLYWLHSLLMEEEPRAETKQSSAGRDD